RECGQGDHDCGGASGFGATHHTEGDLIASAPIELVVPWSTVKFIGDFLHRYRRLGRDRHRGSGVASSLSGGTISPWVDHLGHSDRHKQKRGGQWLAEQFHRGASHGDRGCDARYQLPLVKRGAVGRGSGVAAGRSINVAASLGGHFSNSRVLQILNVHRHPRTTSIESSTINEVLHLTARRQLFSHVDHLSASGPNVSRVACFLWSGTGGF